MESENKKTVHRGGISFMGALALVFITLKLLGVIDWAWIWVLAPLWVGAALYIAITVAILAFIGITRTARAIINRRRYAGEKRRYIQKR